MNRALLLLLAACPTPARQETPATPPAKPYKFNQRIEEEFHLPDLAGKDHALFAEHEDQALVLVFWSYKDPVSRFYHAQLAQIEKARAGKIAVLLVDSNHDELARAGDPLEKLRTVVAAEKVTLTLLLDHESTLADDLGATANGQCFVIDANRVLRYNGGIDDDPNGERRKAGVPLRNWLEDAIDEVLAGEALTQNWTRPSGRPIKRAPEFTQAGGGKQAPK